MTRRNLRFPFVLATLAFLLTAARPSPFIQATRSRGTRPHMQPELESKGRKIHRARSIELTDDTFRVDQSESTDNWMPRTESNLKRVKLYRAQVDATNPYDRIPSLSSLIEDDRRADETRDERRTNVERTRRNASVPLNAFKGSKRGHKKLKLAQAQARKSSKGKERSDDSDASKKHAEQRKVVRRHANVGSIRSKRYAVSRSYGDERNDYYAQRRAVMERFYARQREIAEKYARKLATTPRYIERQDAVNETDARYFSANGKNTSNNESNSVGNIEGSVNETGNAVDRLGNASSSTTMAAPSNGDETGVTATERYREKSVAEDARSPGNSAEDNIEEDASDDYDYYTLEDNKLRQTSDATSEDNGTLNDAEWASADSGRDTMKWGNCTGKLVYQHNLIIGVHKATLADADLATTLEGPFCITCVRVVPASTNKATVSLDVSRRGDGSLSLAKLRFKGFQDDELSYIVKVWAVGKRNDRCDHV